MIRLPLRAAFASMRSKPAQADRSGSEARDGGTADGGVDGRDSVRGERGVFTLGVTRSLQSRMSSLMAAGLMIAVGAGMLAWYYGEALSRPVPPSIGHAPPPASPGEGLALPPFGSVERQGPPPPVRAGVRLPVMTLPMSSSATSKPLTEVPAGSLLAPPLSRAWGVVPGEYGGPQTISPRQRRLDRRLSGEVFVHASSGPRPGLTDGGAAAVPLAGYSRTATEQSSGDPQGSDALGPLLKPTVHAATRAQVLPSLGLLLPKGTFLDCTLETAIDSTLPGMTTCVTAADTFGADGTVVLLERGTKLIGETRGEVRQGQARVFVVWTEARTPAGVVVRLDSPGTDALGRSGLEGKVNRHFWQRFGAAALVSTIDGVVQSEVQSSSRAGTVVLDPTTSTDVLTEILRGTVGIPPTIRVRNGARIQVLVARDVDFRTVYELVPR